MARRPLLLALLTGALLAGTTGATASLAAPSAAGTSHGDKRVCARPTAGHAACDAHVRTKGGNVTPDATPSYTSGYAPAQLRKAYGLTTDSTATVAIIDAYAHPNAQADLNVYRAQFGIPATTISQVNQNGGTTLAAGDTGWGQEEMLDLEMVSAICPGCHILYIGANSASFTDLGTAVNRAATLGAKVISNSYGGNESSSEVSIQSSYYTHPGVAITVSSGDSGYGAQSPAAFNTVTAVGGSHLPLDAAGNRTAAETVWSGAGSGCSAYIAKPTWQHDTACSRRTVADVSAVADPATGVAVYDSYGSTGGANWYVFGGTSVAAPIIGAVYALNGTITTTGTPASRAYAAAAGTFYDVASGSNGRCVHGQNTSASYLCTGTAGLTAYNGEFGYDGPTGLGTPKGTAGF